MSIGDPPCRLQQTSGTPFRKAKQTEDCPPLPLRPSRHLALGSSRGRAADLPLSASLLPTPCGLRGLKGHWLGSRTAETSGDGSCSPLGAHGMRRQDSGRLTKLLWVGQSRSWRSPGFESRARAERSLAQHLLSVHRNGCSSRAVRGWSPVVPGNSICGPDVWSQVAAHGMECGSLRRAGHAGRSTRSGAGPSLSGPRCRSPGK